MKKFVCLLLVALLLLPLGCGKKRTKNASAAKTVLAESVTIDGAEARDEYAWYYHLQADGTAMLDCCVNLSISHTLVLPEKVDGHTVTALGRNAFRDEEYGMLMYTPSVTIPDCITRIEGNPFSEAGYGGIVVSDTHPTLEIQDGALFDKREKRLIVAFAAAEGERIPEGTEIVEDYALSHFQVCSWEITIPASVKTIGHNPFCRQGMKHITVAEDNPYFEMRDGFLFDKREQRLIIVEYDKYWEEINNRSRRREALVCEIPDGTKIIDDFAFYGLSGMWGNIAFSIPDSVKEIGVNPFGYDKKYELSPGNTAFEITGGVLYSKADKRVICGIGYNNPTTLPAETEIIGDYASVRTEGDYAIPDNVKEIGTHAFYGTGEIVLPKSIRRIGPYSGCIIQNEKLVLPGNVIIASCAFTCSLTEIEIGDGDSILHSGMLEYASAADTMLKRVSIGKGETVIGRKAFGMCTAEFTVYRNSYAEQYAQENGLSYRYAD